jgi:hypothetical protein
MLLATIQRQLPPLKPKRNVKRKPPRTDLRAEFSDQANRILLGTVRPSDDMSEVLIAYGNGWRIEVHFRHIGAFYHGRT